MFHPFDTELEFRQRFHPGITGESEGGKAEAKCAEQGHDPGVAEPQGRSTLPVRCQRGERDPLEGGARKDTALPDTVSIGQTGVGVTVVGLSFGRWCCRSK